MSVYTFSYILVPVSFFFQTFKILTKLSSPMCLFLNKFNPTTEYYTDSTVTPVSGNSNDFTALPNVASTASTRQISFAANENSGTSVLKPISLTILNDNICESTETFNVYLTNMVGAVAGDQRETKVTIQDDDSEYLTESLNFFLVGMYNPAIYELEC